MSYRKARAGAATASAAQDVAPPAAGWGNAATAELLASSGQGPFSDPLNQALSTAFGRDVGHLPPARLDGATGAIGARGYTAGEQMVLNPSDGDALGLAAHETAHALAGGGRGDSLVDGSGDAGEAGAAAAERSFGAGFAAGRLPSLSPATGGGAAIHRAEETCSTDENTDPSAIRAQLVQDALGNLPTLDGVSAEVAATARTQVEAAVGSAFDACLAVALRDDPLGECADVAPEIDAVAEECATDAADTGECREVTPAATAVPTRVALDAERRYRAGPGIAVGKLGALLDEVRGETPLEPAADVYDDDQLIEALTRYDGLVSRSLQAYGIQTNPNITLASAHSSGNVDDANADENIQDVIEGNDADRSSYGNAPGGTVRLSDEVLDALDALARTYTYRVSEITGGEHSAGSRHYAGVAIDFDLIDGRVANASNPSQLAFRADCTALGATEVIGPPSAGHATHVHAAWPRP